ncbi:MAG: glycosyltransferase family 2 protein [Acidimicrobiales bacterium]
MSNLFLGGANAIAFLLCAAFVAYVLCIVIPVLRHRPSAPGDPEQFDWHFLIPCLDEERVIAATIADLLTKFPSCHVWCVDDASHDETLKILSRLTSRARQVHIVRRRAPNAQQGKGPALNAGWKAIAEHLPPGTDLDRIIVGVVDADGSLDPKCLSIISGPTLFGNPEIGAVQILVRVVDQKSVKGPLWTRLLTRMQDLEFTSVIAGMQMLRSHVGSSAMGGNGQFTRASALKKLTDVYGEPWKRALVEDFELGLRILLTGGGTEYCHDTYVAQQGPPTLRRLIRQRSRWAQGMMQCFQYFMPVMRSREITTGAAMEIAVFLLLPWAELLGTVVYVASLGVLLFVAVTTTGGPLHWFGGGAWGLIPLFLIFGLAPLACWGPIYRRVIGHDEVSRTKAFVLGLANWPYSYVAHLANYWAFGRMLRSRHDWKKTERIPVQPVRTAGGRGLVVPVSVGRAAAISGAGGTQPNLAGVIGTAALNRSLAANGRPARASGHSAGRQRTVTLHPATAGEVAPSRHRRSGADFGPVTTPDAVSVVATLPPLTPVSTNQLLASGGDAAGIARAPLGTSVALPTPRPPEVPRQRPPGIARGTLRAGSSGRTAVVGGRLRLSSTPALPAAPEPAEVARAI